MFGKIGLVILLYFFLRLDTFLKTKAKIQHLNSTHYRVFWVFGSSGGRLGAKFSKSCKRDGSSCWIWLQAGAISKLSRRPNIQMHQISISIRTKITNFLLPNNFYSIIVLRFVFCFAFLFRLFFLFFLAPLMFYLLHCSKF